MPEISGVKYKPEVRILCGLPASGKSREALGWVKKDPQHRTRINYDDLRKEMFPSPDWRWNRKDEEAMKARAVELFENAIQLGMSVVIDNTNLSRHSREAWKQRAIAHSLTWSIEEIGSDTPIWELAARDKARGEGRVGRAVIERMALFNGFIDWNDKHRYKKDGFVICDLDGTLCDITHRRHFVDGTNGKKDWKSFFASVKNDKLCGPVSDLLDVLGEDRHILLVSGRPIDQCGIATEDWLKVYDINYDHLFMRQGGDNRPDTIIKKEILDLLPKDRIDFVLDDRDSVVKMWRDNGLFCLQVADGDF